MQIWEHKNFEKLKMLKKEMKKETHINKMLMFYRLWKILYKKNIQCMLVNIYCNMNCSFFSLLL